MLTQNTRRVFLFVCLGLLLLVRGFPGADAGLRAVRVHDGDTITLAGGMRVRYIGINAPEIDHERHEAAPFGFEARDLNQTLVNGKFLRLETDRQQKDRFGRTLAYVFLPDGRMVNEILLAEGLAFHLPDRRNLRYDRRLLEAQRAAMRAGKGMWAGWREAERAVYPGSRASKRFHAPSCPYGARISPRNRILFESQWEAFWAGYAPGKQCLGKERN